MSQQAKVTLYTTRWCGFCARAKALLEHKGARYTEIPVDNEPERRQEMMQLAAVTPCRKSGSAMSMSAAATSFMPWSTVASSISC